MIRVFFKESVCNFTKVGNRFSVSFQKSANTPALFKKYVNNTLPVIAKRQCIVGRVPNNDALQCWQMGASKLNKSRSRNFLDESWSQNFLHRLCSPVHAIKYLTYCYMLLPMLLSTLLLVATSNPENENK